MPELYDPPEIEYLDGRAVPKVSPKQRHSVVQRAVAFALHACAGSRGSTGTECRFHPGGEKRTDERQEPPFSPDVAVEVRSPSDRLTFLRKKIARYLATGSVLVLDVDPAARTIDAHSADGLRRYCAGERFQNEAVPWLVFEVDAVFGDLDEFGL